MKKLMFLVLSLATSAFAQNWFVGVGTTVSTVPATLLVGYNAPGYGVRLSGDLMFVGVDVYGRLPFDSAGSSLYAGGGLGYNLTGAFAETLTTSQVTIPLSAEAVLGFEYVTQGIGFFLEYAPVFALAHQENTFGFAGLMHFRVGTSIHF
jgi:hypothetical protein